MVRSVTVVCSDAIKGWVWITPMVGKCFEIKELIEFKLFASNRAVIYVKNEELGKAMLKKR